MKKIIALIVSIAVIASMGIVASFAAGHVSRDEVTISDTEMTKGTSLAQVGQNAAETDIGDITPHKIEYILIYGWYANDIGIQEFGYRINDGDDVMGLPKFEGGDAALIAQQAGLLGYPDGESVRFKILVPVQVGTDITVTPLFMDEDGEINEMDWTVKYTNSYVPSESPDDPAASDEPNTPNENTADGTAIVFMVAAAAVVATVLLKKKAF